MRKLIFINLFFVTLSMSACSHGPQKDELITDLQNRLAQHFGEDLFEITEFNRRGFYPYVEEEDKRERVFIYYDAQILFLKDHKLSDWDKLNVGSLIYVLGATTQGIDGVRAGGNSKGDIIKVRGGMAFVSDAEGWVATNLSADSDDKKERAPSDKKELPYNQHLETIAKAGTQLHLHKDSDAMTDLTAALGALASRTERRVAQLEGAITIATGPSDGEYARHGQNMTRVLNTKEIKAHAFYTAGSRQNCRFVHEQEAQIGYSQNDVVHHA
ncbi:hypothetical protein KAI87_15620, partial [Myxococcota bacterium]|nr:hypothetical protein [Myxococcota bacterium]